MSTMSAKDIKEQSSLNRRTFLQGVGALVATGVVGCSGEEKATNEGAGEQGGQDKPGVGEAKAPAPSKLKQFEKGQRLRMSLTDHAHFADRSRDGLLAIEMGAIAARKYLNGGWRAGWDTTPRKDGNENFFEADSKSVRVFFKHTKGGFDRITVRMKAVKKGNKLTAYVNDEAIKSFEIDGDWKDYTIKIPAKATRAGENQLMMRFQYDTTVGGRKQVAHISSVHVLPANAKVEDAPRGPSLQNVTLEGGAKEALVAATPQTYTFRLQMPTEAPQLALAWGAKEAGAKFTITAAADTVPAKTVMDETCAADKAGKWNESIVDLSAFAGKVVELNFTSSGAWKGGQLAAWGQPGIYSPKSGELKAKDPKTPAKNLVVYLIDTLRYDKFDFYNNKSNCKTPQISEFAKDATIFDAGYDNENWTKPSTASILTGLYPETHKAKEDTSKLPTGALMISQHLKKQGFTTGSFLANGYVSDAFGFKKGWDHYTNYIRETRNTNADNVVKESLAWIDENKDKRFFAYIHTIDPHVPYSPPEKYRKMYWNRDYDGPIKPQATGDQLADIKTGKLEVNNKDKKYLEALYNGETTFNDFAFGELIKGLKEKGLYENTAILIIADHGEEFWDHGKVGHGHSLYEEMVHSPLVVRYPNMAPVGKRIPHVVSMVDLAPTLCDLAGVDKSDTFEGTSFTDTFDGIGEPRPRVAVSDFLYRRKSVRAGRYKWITIGRGGKLYDVVGDPKESKDLISKHHIARAFVRANFGIFRGAKNKSVWWEGSDKEAPSLNLETDNAQIDDDTQKMLEAMGYVDGAKGDMNAEEDKKAMEKEDN